MVCRKQNLQNLHPDENKIFFFFPIYFASNTKEIPASKTSFFNDVITRTGLTVDVLGEYSALENVFTFGSIFFASSLEIISTALKLRTKLDRQKRNKYKLIKKKKLN